MDNKYLYIETYGCQMNVSDTEVIFSIMAKHGYQRTEDITKADIILANTCSIRDNAEQRIYGRLEVFAKEKKQRPGIIVGIVGCMAERLKEALLDSGKVDIVAGPDSYRSLPSLAEAVRPGQPQINVLLSHEETYADIIPVRTDKNGVSAFVSIMRGCNNVCSYCVVPYTRGAERSRDPHTIVREVCKLVADGYKEVTLLGQNVDSYFWKDESGNVDFADLLAMVADVNPSLRVRFSTSHPKDISDKLIETMASRANICRCIHLPVQSGSDRMLEKMRRRYTREWYLGRVAKIRKEMPDCAITTDIIAGFCSETEQDHKDTLSIMEQVKTRRLNEIIELQNRLGLESNKRDVGKTFTVLVEGPSKRNADELCGRASNNKMCVFPDKVHKAGDYVSVKVLSCTSATLICELV